MNILLAESSVTIATGIANHLDALDLNSYHRTASLEEAMMHLDEQAITFVITGWQLTDSTGITLTREIRTRPDHQDLPILMISPHGDKRRVMQAHRAGVDGYLLRPFARRDLEVKIETVAAKRGTPLSVHDQ